MELLSLNLVPDPLTDLKQIVIHEPGILTKRFRRSLSLKGKFALYALVKINGFMQVINGAPGATGPVLNHYNNAFVRQYLNRMSDAIEKRTGPLSENIRASVYRQHGT